MPVANAKKNNTVGFRHGSIRASLKKGLVFLIEFLAIISLVSGLAAVLIFVRLVEVLPSPTPEAMLKAPESTRILDRNGEFLYEVHSEVKRTRLALAEIPRYLQAATIAIEDKNFYRHHGFDLISILRAIRANFNNGEIRQGASTITQQVARTAFLDNQPTFSRKIKELVLAVKIEWFYTKDEILEMYLNNIPYGSNAYGVEAASEIYFNKRARDLNLIECAYLAALPKAPTSYSPFGPNIEILRQRARLVIEKMSQLGVINEVEAKTALAQKNIEFKRIPIKINAPHFVFYVLDVLTAEYGEEKVRQGGMVVYTSLDLTLQHQAEKIVSEQGLINEKKYQAGNAALVALNTRTGEILAMVGSRDYFKPGDGAFNVALSPRQPGSSFKPYVYATAMTNGLNPATMLFDVETNFKQDNNGINYIPRNYNGRHYGPISLRQALAGSLNIPAVKTLVLVGIDKSIDTAEKLGLTTLKDRRRFGPALVLGGAEVKLLEHTAGLGALGNNGIKPDLMPILKITDTKNNLIRKNKEQPGTAAVDPQAAYLITDILSDSQARVFIFRHNKNLEVAGRQVAVKTGTSQDFRDAWTVGYTPSLAVGVWVGNNDNSPMRAGADGSVVAAPIWKKFITEAIAKQAPEKFTRPDGIVELKVDSLTGKLPTEFSPIVKKEIFASYNAPKDHDNAHILVKAIGLNIKTTSLQSEKPNDPLWESGVKNWALDAGLLSSEEIKNYSSVEINEASNVPIVFAVPKNISGPSWEISLEVALTQKVVLTEIFLDNKLIAKNSSKVIHFTSKENLSAGVHRFTALIHTASGDTYTVNRLTEFIISDQEVEALPTNLANNSKIEF